jgi:hypothetical protein
MNWFQRLCLPPESQSATLQTLRHKILLMPAQLRRTHNRPHLALPASVAGEFRSESGGGFAGNVDAIGVPTDSSASMLWERKFAKIDFAYGWTMAIAKERLAEIGGFETMVNLHSDDFTLGNEVAKRGYRVELMRNPVWMVFPEETLKDFLKHELRWCIQLRNLRPVGYLSMFLTFGLAWSLLVRTYRAIREGCGEVFPCLSGAPTGHGVGHWCMGPSRSCGENQVMASAGAGCPESLPICYEFLHQHCGVERHPLSRAGNFLACDPACAR